MNQATFILNVAGLAVIGYVQNAAVAKEKAGEHLVVSEAKDLEGLNLQQLTDLFNTFEGGEPIGKFKISKDKAAAKVFAQMQAMDIATLTQLDTGEEAKIETQAAAQPAGPKVRKERDSKLQRMKHAFLEKDDDGNYKQWTVPELMAKCGKQGDPMTERIATVYVSILRSPTDRFIMNIVKNKDTGAFTYDPDNKLAEAAPAPAEKQEAANSEQVAAAA